MKKLLSVLLVVCIVLSMQIPVFAASNACVYLSDLTPTRTVVRNQNWPWTKDKCSYYGGPIAVGGQTYDKGLSSHASNHGNPVTEIVFDISAYSYNTFSAIFGKDEGNKTGGPSAAQNNPAGVNGTTAAFAVFVDGILAKEGTVTYPETIAISVDIEGASTLSLQILPDGTTAATHPTTVVLLLMRSCITFKWPRLHLRLQPRPRLQPHPRPHPHLQLQLRLQPLRLQPCNRQMLQWLPRH